MKRKIIAILLATLMSATKFAGIATVTADIETIKESDIKWTTIYKVDKEQLEGVRGKDLQIYSIDIGHSIGNNWRVKYYLYVSEAFTGTFTDRLWINDYVIEDHEHDNEYMWLGINGPYYSRWFPAPSKDSHDITVYTDYDTDITETNEYNNDATSEFNFWWLG